jgi:protein phosphatase
MRFHTAAMSDVGRRRQANEDRYALDPALGLFLVADGMGGHQAGRTASERASAAVLAAIDTLQAGPASLAERLRYAVAAATREIFSVAAEHAELAGMGTTLVVLLAGEGRVSLAHVGDSRAYLVRAGGIRQLTDDHSLVAELLRRHKISEDDAREHPHRHVLTRALGVRPAVEPDLAELTPQAGDVFVLCTDGLTNHLLDSEIAKIVSSTNDLEHAVKALTECANGRGGEDNITTVLVRCEG